LGAAIDHLNESGGISKIESQIKGLASKLRKLLQNIDNVVLYHNHKSVELCGIVSFKVRGIESYIIKEAMATSESVGGDRFELSVVPRTSTPIDSSNTKTCDLVRASLTYFNTDEEIERFEAKLRCFIEDIHKTV
jgi:selenocysteine lyase/cysteine desulfurase